jgi:hypothetical protein
MGTHTIFEGVFIGELFKIDKWYVSPFLFYLLSRSNANPALDRVVRM